MKLLRSVIVAAMALAAAALSLSSAPLASAADLPPGFTTRASDEVLLDIPARKMWGWDEGHGYCGETSFQSALLYYGNYVTQEKVRYADGNKELLIGVHDEKAAKNLLLTYEAFDFEEEDNPHATTFLDFVMKHVRAGAPVVAGWFLKKNNGDEDYDHIMPIVGFKGSNNGSKRSPPTSAAITYNDLYVTSAHSVVAGSDAFKTRKQCTTKSPRQPYSYCLPVEANYGIALTGNVDPEGMLYRTILRADKVSEPDWGAEDGLDETPEQQTFAATVYGLTVGEEYSLLRFDSVSSLENSRNFLQLDYSDRVDFTAAATTHEISGIQLRSDGEHYFRTVSVNGIPPPDYAADTEDGEADGASSFRAWSLFLELPLGARIAIGLAVLIAVVAAVVGVAACAAHKACCFKPRAGAGSDSANPEPIDLDTLGAGYGSAAAAPAAAPAPGAVDAALDTERVGVAGRYFQVV